MKEIKFRAWDNKEKKWLLGYDYPDLGGFDICGETIMSGEWGNVIGAFIFERDGKEWEDLKIMQFTGLKDKNNKEIYEGDIIKYTHHKKYLLKDFTAKVEWNNEFACWSFVFIKTSNYSDILLPCEHDEFSIDILPYIEVVGNIYDKIYKNCNI